MRGVLVLVACGACNQLLGVDEFERRDAGGSSSDADAAADAGAPDGMVDAAPPPCNLAAPFGALSAVTELNTNVVDVVTDISADGNTLYVESDRESLGARMYTSTWSPGTQMWGTLVPTFAVTPSYEVFVNRIGTSTGFDIFVARRPLI